MNSAPPLRPTLKDVARAANVSLSAVSYVLNNALAAKRISEPTKKRVRDAAVRLGYKFNPIGRALQRGYTNQVTLLIVTWNLARSHAATAMAISRAAARQELALTVHVADNDEEAEAFLRRSMLHNLEGILVLWDSPAFETSSLRQLALDGVPVVDLLPGAQEGISVVTADREAAGYQATKHLLDLGHKEIGFIGDAQARPQTTLRKLAGYRRALQEAGLRQNQALVQDVEAFGFEGGRDGVQKLFSRCPGVTALFCINDAMALGAIEAARDMGKSCPESISVVGFGDSPEGSHWRPKLTTIALSSDRVAKEAIELIAGSIAGEVSRDILIPEELIVRESTSQLR